LRNDKGQYHQAQKHGGSADNRHGPSVVSRYVFKTKQFVPPFFQPGTLTSEPFNLYNNLRIIKKVYPS
jgi:hypothetical protein